MKKFWEQAQLFRKGVGEREREHSWSSCVLDNFFGKAERWKEKVKLIIPLKTQSDKKVHFNLAISNTNGGIIPWDDYLN